MKQQASIIRFVSRVFSLIAAAALVLATANAGSVITNVVETGGDNEATDTVLAVWTGQMLTNYVSGEYPDTNPYLVPTFGENVKCFVDRLHSWRSTNGMAMPPYLIGGDYVMSGNDNRDNANYTLSISLAVPAYVYILVDNRLGDGVDADPPAFATNMTWLLANGWVATSNGLNRAARTDWPDEVFQDNDANFSIEDEYSVYVKHLPAGAFQTFQADNANRGMYAVVAQAAAPPAPATIAAKKLDGGAQITWGAVAGSTSYNVKRAATAGGPYVTVTNTTELALVDSGLVNGTTYYYVVSGVDAVGEGPNSAEVTVTPNLAVADLTAAYAAGVIQLSWPEVAGATNYNVYRATTAGGPYTTLSTTVTDTNFVDNTFTNGATYYYVVSANLPGGEGVNSPERSVLTPPAIVTQPVSQTLPDGGSFTLTVAAVGQGTFTYQWRKDGVNVGTDSASYSVAVATTSDSGGYDVVVSNAAGSSTSAVATVTVLMSPVITAQPPATSFIKAGTLVGITVEARGQTPLAFQWQKFDGADWQEVLSEVPAQSNTYTRLAWSAADSGDYRVVITNDLGAVTSAVATVTVVLPITIDTQPVASQVVTSGSPATFSVVASGNLLNYQWRKGGAAISGAISSSYTITSTTSASEGNYDVVVTNLYFAVTSTVSFLDIKYAPVITTQPANQTVVLGAPATFTVAVNADPAVSSYQWQLNGIDIPGATGASYTIPAAYNQDVGLYSVVVANDVGTATSASASLKVGYPNPTVFDQFPSVSAFTNSYATNAGNFNWVSSGGVNNSSCLDVPNNADGSAIYTNRSFDFSQPGKVLGLSMMVKLKSNGGTQRILQFGFVQDRTSRFNDNSGMQWISLRWDTTGTGLETTIRHQNKQSSGTGVNDGIIKMQTRSLAGWYKVVVWFENIGGDQYKISGGVWDYTANANGTTPGRMILWHPETIVDNPVICHDSTVWAGFRGNNDTGTDNLDDFAIFEGYRPLPLIATAPVSQTVNVGSMATFRVGLEGSLLANPVMQWYANGVAIPNGTNMVYTTPPLKNSDNGTLYYVVVSNPFGSVTSSVARVTVTGTDTTAPTLVSAGSATPSVVGLRFSETLDPATSQNPANYTVSGVTVTKATLLSDAKTVRLEVNPGLTSAAFSVTAANIADVSGNVGGGTVDTIAWTGGWIATNYGFPLVQGKLDLAVASNAVDFTAGGADIWNAMDSGFMFLKERTGNFDVMVQVQDVVRAPEGLIMEAQNSSDLAKFGLVARDDLSPISPQITFHPFPPAGSYRWNGLNRYEAGQRSLPGVSMATFFNASTPTVSFPTWIRLRRAGDTFTIYQSTNGVDWAQLGQYVKAGTAPSMFVGLMGTVHFNTSWYMGSATGKFQQFSDFTYPGATVTITTDLAPTATVNENGTLTFNIAATATVAPASELRYIWQRAAAGGPWLNITNLNAATATSYTTPALKYATDNGARYRCVVEVQGAQAVSTETVVTVTDAVQPTLVSATMMTGMTNGVLLNFSEPLDPASLGSSLIFVTGPLGLVPIQSTNLFGDGSRMLLTFGPDAPTGAFTVSVDLLYDKAGNVVDPSFSTANFNYDPAAQVAALTANPIQLEFYLNQSGMGGAVQEAIYMPRVLSARYDIMFYTNLVGFATNLADTGMNNYITRMRGYYVPPVTDWYRIWTKSDDGSRLMMNTNAVDSWDPAGAVWVASSGGSSGNSYATGSRTTMYPLYLIAGQKYYFEFYHAEGTGGDGFGIARTQGTGTTAPVAGEIIPISEIAAPMGNVSIRDLFPAMPLKYYGPTTFSVKGIQGAGPYIVQWFRNGVPIPGAQGYSTTINLTAADAGAVISCSISNLFSVATVSTTVAFEQDSTPLQIAAIRSSPKFDGVTLVFNKVLDPATVYNWANYQFGGGLTLADIVLRPDGKTVFLKTSLQQEYTSYPLVVSGLQDASPTPVALGTVNTNFTSQFLVQGYLRVERYDQPGDWRFIAPGTPNQGLYLNPKFVNNTPDYVGTVNQFYYTTANPNLEYYGAQAFGFFVPPVSGNYTFYTRSDDGSEMFLNPQGMYPDGKVLVSRQYSSSRPYDDGQNGVPRFSVASLVAGQRYYIELNVQEGTGGDSLQGVVRGPGEVYVPGTTEPAAAGVYFMKPVPAENRTDVFVLKEVGTVNVDPGQQATLSGIMVATDVSFAPTAVWARETSYGSGVFTNIPFAYGTTYVTPPLYEPTNRFRLTVYSPSGFASSIGTVVLNAAPTAGPRIIGTISTLDHTTVRVQFADPVDATTAAVVGNYRLTGAFGEIPLTGAALEADGKTVTLTLGQTLFGGAGYTVTVNNVKDLAGNTIPADSAYQFWAPQGYIVRKQFNYTTSPSTIAAFTNDAAFRNDTPTLIELMPRPDKPQIVPDLQNYCTRYQGYIIPEKTGNYTFFVASDDQSELWLSTDENPNNIRLLCYEQGHANGLRNWTGPGSGRTINTLTGAYYNQSAPVFLQAGKKYYVDMRHREGSGGDYAGFNWMAPGELAPANGTVSRIGPSVLAGLTVDAPASVSPLPPLIVTNELATVTFAPVITGNPNLAIQWRLNGVPISGATAPTYTTPILTYPAFDNVTYDVVVSCLYNTVTSTPAVVQVVQDVAAPTVVGGQGGYRGTRDMVLTFNEPVSAASATNPANYLVTNETSVLTVAAATLLSGNKQVVLSLVETPVEGANYTITALNIADQAGTPNVAAQLSAPVTAWVFSTNYVYYEVYTNITGDAVTALTGSAKYQANTPDIAGYTNQLSYGGSLAGNPWDNYGFVARGYYTPPADGLYVIYVAHDNGLILRASTNDNTAAAVEIINQAAVQSVFADGVNSFTNFLVGGQKYYFELLGKEGTSGDYFKLAITPFVADPLDPSYIAPSNLPPLSGKTLGAYAPPGGTVTIATQPLATEGLPYHTATFSVAAEATPASLNPFLTYQWRTNGVDIPGATGPTYTTPLLSADSAAAYSVVVSAPGATPVVSADAALTMGFDVDAPKMDWAVSLDGRFIYVHFNELVETNSASDPSAYMVNNENGSVATATLLADQQTVLIEVYTPVTGTFTVQSYLVYDLNGNYSFDFDNITGRVLGLASSDLGTVTLPSVVTLLSPTSFSVQTDGADIWGTADAGDLFARSVTGDFDVAVRVSSLFLANAWTKAGLMARESTNANSLNFYMASTPVGGQNTFSAQWRETTGGSSVSTGDASIGLVRPPVSLYPNNWVRIARVGNTFYAYYSFDGVNWTLHYARTMAFPKTLLVGLATTSHDAAIRTTAVYDNLYFPFPPTFTAQPAETNVTVALHGSLNLSATAENPTNSGPLTYQWRKDGVDLPGQTNNTLSLANLSAADAGVYYLAAGNHGGEAWSLPVTVQVANQLVATTPKTITSAEGLTTNIPLSVILGTDNDPEGDPVAFQRVYPGQPRLLNYNFNDGLAPADTVLYGLARVDTIGGFTGGALKLTDAVGSQSGSFLINDAAISNMTVGEFTIAGKLFIGNGSANPADGMSFNFAPDVPESAPGNAEEGAGTGFSVTIDTYLPTTDAGVEVKVGTWVVRYPFAAAPRMTSYQDVYIHMDPDGTVDVAIDGVTYFTNFPTPYRPITGGRFLIAARTGGEYQAHWLDDLSIVAVPAKSALGASVTFANDVVTYAPPAGACGQDTFYYSVTDGQVGGTVVQAVTVIMPETSMIPPTFLVGLTNQTLAAGTAFTAELPDLRSQVVATDNCCCVTLTQTPAAGTVLPLGDTVVELVATDAAGLKATNQATVTVVPTTVPTITQEPTNLIVTVGGTATFSVGAIGGAPLVYQWQVGGVDIPDATSATLTITNVQMANQGVYTVIVSNQVGAVTSAAGILTVLESAPVIVAPALAPAQFGLQVNTTAGLWYWLEYKDDLNAPAWTRLPATQGDGTPLTLQDLDPSNVRRFYKVGVSPTNPGP